MSIQFKGETEQHLMHSPFSSMDDAFRFIDWFWENRGHVSAWDIYRYNWAVRLIVISDVHED